MCQRLTACPFVQTVHFPESAFKWTHALEMDAFSPQEKPWKTRFRCKECGACVATRNPKVNKWVVYSAQLERDADGKIKNWDALKPTAHIFYETRMLDVNDDLGKWAGYENQSKQVAERP